MQNINIKELSVSKCANLHPLASNTCRIFTEIYPSSLEALKALACDLLVEAERVQKNIQLVNQYIQKKLEEEIKTPTEEPKA